MQQPSLEERVAAIRVMRVTWHTARMGALVWVRYKGRWAEGIITGLGRNNIKVTVATRKGKPKVVKYGYNDARVRRSDLDGADIPVEPC